MKRALGRLETQFMAYVQMRKSPVVRKGDIVASPLALSPRQEQNLLNRLTTAGMIVRLRNEVYLVPPRLPLGGTWTPSEALALNTLMQGRLYQICGPNAFNRYGLDEQIPVRTYVYNEGLSGERNIGTLRFTFIKVAAKRLGAVETLQNDEGETLVYSSRVRTLIDALYDWSRFNSLPRAYRWITNELAAKRVSETELVETALQFGDIGTQRRLGVLLERLKINPRLLARLKRNLPETTALIPWIPTQPKRGTVLRSWGVLLNA